jgi:hypothetical protein
MRTEATALDITVTVQPGMVLAPPVSYAIRLGLRQTVGTISLGASVVAFAVFLGSQPWIAGCNGWATVPYLVASVLLAVAADLLIITRTRHRRLRQSAIMNGLMVGVGLTLLICVALNPTLSWPLLFPLLFTPFALPVVLPLNFGIFSRIAFNPQTWRLVMLGCLAGGLLLMVGGYLPMRDHLACQWSTT